MAMKRRDFITLLGTAAIVWSRAARAQQARGTRRIGVLMGGFDKSDREAQSWISAFREELQKLGWKEDQSVKIDVRWAKADVEVMKASANELVLLQPDLLLTVSTPATGVMLQLTRTIPIIFLLVADPVGSHFVASRARPGGNGTGFTPIVGSLGGKWVELLKEIAPQLGKINLMFNPPTAPFVETYLSSFKAAALSLDIEPNVTPILDMRQVEGLVSASDTNTGLVVIPDAFTVGHRAEITLLADRYHVPAISWSRSFAELGGLIS
jgi:putative ABC transport system substrate-binding protein